MKNKKQSCRSTLLAGGLLSLVFLMLIALNLVAGDHWIDSDMAAEMIFSKLIAEEGGLIATTNWFYSTEFRILYTQLIMVPLFHIFEDWHVIRTITNIVTYMVLLSSYFYFMKPLAIKKSTVIYSSVILLLPFSETIMTHVQMGNTYMPHMIIIFFCFGMFLRLVQGGQKKAVHRSVLLLLYVFLSVICGMSGVRYVLALQAPLVLTGLWMIMDSESFAGFRRNVDLTNLRELLMDSKLRYLWFAMISLVSAMVGYLINVVIIARMFQFQTYEATNFIQVFQGVLMERLQNTFGNLLLLFGYIENKGFLSLRGVISLIAFALMIGIVLLTIRVNGLLKNKSGEEMESFDTRRLMVRFFITTFMLNTFVFVFTTSTMSSRYYFTVFMFVLPLLCIYFAVETLPLDRILVMLFLCATMGLTSLKGVYSFLDKDKNAEEKQVAKFLKQEEYDFGYATYWNANIMTELTNGYVEVANVQEVEDMSMFYWSSPAMYYDKTYHQGKTFLLLTTQEARKYEEVQAVLNGVKIYEDDAYVVYHYDTVEDLLQ